MHCVKKRGDFTSHGFFSAVKPAKPRNFIRPISGAHRNDAFRSRIPNSSRAPSLHVDDFIALEKHNQQAATTGYNRIPGKHQVSDITGNIRNRLHSFLQDRSSHFHSSFRTNRGEFEMKKESSLLFVYCDIMYFIGVMNSWHPLLATKPTGRNVVKTQTSVIRHPASSPLMIRGADLMRFSLAMRWAPPSVRPGPPPPPQLRHHAPTHSSLHRHLRPPPPFQPL